MGKYSKGCKPPADLAARMHASAASHSQMFKTLPHASDSSYDAREHGRVSGIKDQSQCGTCWLFAAMASAESAALVAGLGTSDKISWSEQCVMDCTSNGGCSGDWPETALAALKGQGTADTAQYPYRARAGRCQTTPRPNKISDYGYVSGSNAVPPVQAIKNVLKAKGVLPVAVAADSAFEAYSGGIFRDSGSSSIDHVVGLVAWQDDPSMREGGYWTIKNSWGKGWGESGFMRIAYGANQIGYGAMWSTCQAPGPGPGPGPGPQPVPAEVQQLLQQAASAIDKVCTDLGYPPPTSQMVVFPGSDPIALHMSTVNFWLVLRDCAAIVSDSLKQDWAAVATDVYQLLTDLGLPVNPVTLSAISGGLRSIADNPRARGALPPE